MSSRLVMSEKLFDLPLELVAELRQVEAAREWRDEITREYDAFLLDAGLGPVTYLSTDGRVIWDDSIGGDCVWGVEGTSAEAYMAIVAGAHKTGVTRLLDLLPKRPPDAIDCRECDGSGWFNSHGQLVDVNGQPFSFVCTACAGLGWEVALDELDG
jgi:hypothetical protein